MKSTKGINKSATKSKKPVDHTERQNNDGTKNDVSFALKFELIDFECDLISIESHRQLQGWREETESN